MAVVGVNLWSLLMLILLPKEAGDVEQRRLIAGESGRKKRSITGRGREGGCASQNQHDKGHCSVAAAAVFTAVFAALNVDVLSYELLFLFSIPCSFHVYRIFVRFLLLCCPCCPSNFAYFANIHCGSHCTNNQQTISFPSRRSRRSPSLW